jgi:hypothetical protein
MASSCRINSGHKRPSVTTARYMTPDMYLPLNRAGLQPTQPADPVGEVLHKT